MTLPNENNQWINVTTFNAAARCADAQKTLKVSLKRRTVAAGADTYDSNWADITKYIISVGDITYGVDDQEWITGVMRNANVDIVLDNSDGKFNSRTDQSSLWYDATTSYYLANSLVKIEFGFMLPSGSTYWGALPFHSGLIALDSIRYGADNTVAMTIVSKLDWLRSRSLGEVIDYDKPTYLSSVSGVDRVFNFINSTAPAALSLTCVAASLRNDIIYSDYNSAKNNAYDFVADTAKNSSSIFGINRSNKIFITYFNNPYYQASTSAFTADTSTVLGLWNFGGTTNTTKNIHDDSGNGRDLIGYVFGGFTGTAGMVPITTTGKFGSALEYKDPRGGFYALFGGAAVMSTTSSSYSVEALFMINEEWNANAYPFLSFGQNAATATNLCWVGRAAGKYLANAIGNPASQTSSRFSTELKIGAKQYQYLAFVSDGAAAESRMYVNGQLIQVVATTPAAANWPLDINGQATDIIWDSLRFTNAARTDENIKNQTAQIFGNNFSLQTSTAIAYDFYNYGPKSNIIDVQSYDDGVSRIYNAVEIDGVNNWAMTFQVASVGSDNLLVSWYAGASFWPNPGAGSYTPATLTGGISELIATINNNSVGNFTATYSAADSRVTVRTTNTDETFLKTSNLSVSHQTNPPSYAGWWFTPPTSSGYSRWTGDKITTIFTAQGNLLQNIIIDTASTYEYGRRSTAINRESLNLLTYSQTATLAQSILAERAQPKARMVITTRFLEGDLDILNKVSVHWLPDIADGGAMLWDSGSWGDLWAQAAGRITWDAKDFYVVGIAHSFSNCETKYTLREV